MNCNYHHAPSLCHIYKGMLWSRPDPHCHVYKGMLWSWIFKNHHGHRLVEKVIFLKGLLVKPFDNLVLESHKKYPKPFFITKPCLICPE